MASPDRMNIRVLTLLGGAIAGVAFGPAGQAQTPQITGILSAASYQSAAAPGALISIFGTGLATDTGQASSTPLPFYLKTTSVYINGIAAPLAFVSPTQINAQVPYEIPGDSSASVQVVVNKTTGPNATLYVSTAAPAIFTQTSSGTGLASVFHANYSYVTESSPAQPGETVLLYATGLGATTPGLATGAPGSGEAFAQTPVIGVGGLRATLPFAGAAPGFAGLAQLNFTIPYVNAGDQALVIYMNGTQSSAAVTIPVSQASEQLQSIPPTYFGIHLAPEFLTGKTPWPVLQFGALRLLGDTVTWADMEPSEGVFDFTFLDSMVAGAQQHNLSDVLMTLVKTPTWASSNMFDYGCSDYLGRPGGCDAPLDLNGDGSGADQYWKDFVTALVQHECTPGPCSIQNWEVWNEPNAINFWTGTSAQLVRLTQDAQAIIKGINPNLRVITPPPAGAGDPSSNGATFLQSFLQAGGGRYADIISFHGYLNPVDVLRPELLTSGLNVLLQTRSGDGSAAMPLWDTEGSWARTQNLPDLDLEASFLARYYLLQATYVQRFYWYAYSYPEGQLYNPNTGQLNAAGVAYGQIYNWLIGSVPAVPCNSTGTVFTCGFTRPGGYQGLAVWDSSQTCGQGSCGTSTYTPPPGYVHYRDLAGHQTSIQQSTIQIGIKPVLLENQNP